MESGTSEFNYLLWEGLGILLCIFFSAFFSGTETALTALSETRARQMVQSYGRWARVLLLWIDTPNRTLTTILIGNNLFNILASSLATDLAQRTFASQAIAIAVGIMTFLILIFGEITPKTYAKFNAERLVVPSMRLLQIFYYITYPLARILTAFTGGLIRLTGGYTTHQGPQVTEEDIEYLVDLGTKEGSIRGEYERLLNSVFDFTDLVVREIMVPRTDMKVVDITTSPHQAVKCFEEYGYSRLPVKKENVDAIEGVLYLRDLIPYLSRGDLEEGEGDIRDSMREPYFVPEQMKISTLFREFQSRKLHLAVVVDEYGGTAGLVTLEDVIEVIFGEIFDEYDQEEEEIIKKGEGVYAADATIAIHELEDILEIDFPDDGEYDTLNGFLISITGMVPEVDSDIAWKNLRFHVEKADVKMVKRVEITRLPLDEEEDSGAVQEGPQESDT